MDTLGYDLTEEVIIETVTSLAVAIKLRVRVLGIIRVLVGCIHRPSITSPSLRNKPIALNIPATLTSKILACPKVIADLLPVRRVLLSVPAPSTQHFILLGAWPGNNPTRPVQIALLNHYKLLSIKANKTLLWLVLICLMNGHIPGFCRCIEWIGPTLGAFLAVQFADFLDCIEVRVKF
jgi:hypothetical protein